VLCASGTFCVNGIMRVCPVGTYNSLEGASTCEECPAGTYSYDQVGRHAVCESCPMDHYCQNSTVAVRCPENTVAQEGSDKLQKCTCVAGYQCSYQKVLTFRVLYNASTESGFNNLANNSDLIGQFKLQIANTCEVDPSKVTFLGVQQVEVAA